MPVQSDRRQLMQLSLVAAASGALPLGALQSAGAVSSDPNDPVHAFDLFPGVWNVRHKQLKARLAGSAEWLEFDGTQTFVSILGGQGNADDQIINKPGDPYRGFTVRLYDPKTQTWRIWWFDSRFPTAAIDPPMVGTFKDGVGTFLADDTFNGKPIKVRFLWTRSTPKSRQWEQAFSPDGGTTWETNWIAWFTKIA